MADTPVTLLRRAVGTARHAGSPRTVLVVMCAGYFLVLLDVASAMNNTARQTGGAIGIAVAGAVAGQPGDGERFVRGFHIVALGAAGLYAAAALVTLLMLPGALVPGRER